MKAICLHQPWASLMACGAKTIETRSRRTHYRGQLAICASKYWDDKCAEVAEKAKKLGYLNFYTGYTSIEVSFGKVLCIVDLHDCWATPLLTMSFKTVFKADEWEFGDYSPGRWGWLTRNAFRLETPVPVIGRQGFFNLTPDVEKAVRSTPWIAV